MSHLVWYAGWRPQTPDACFSYSRAFYVLLLFLILLRRTCKRDDIDFRTLQPQQIVNHFRKNSCLTTKVCKRKYVHGANGRTCGSEGGRRAALRSKRRHRISSASRAIFGRPHTKGSAFPPRYVPQVGLAQTLAAELSWFDNTGPDDIFPRCYYISEYVFHSMGIPSLVLCVPRVSSSIPRSRISR